MNRSMLGFCALLALAAPLGGCTMLTEGELGGGSFGYVCESPGDDAVCDAAWHSEVAVPRRVAVGAWFALRFHGDASSPASFLPGSVSADILSPSGSGFLFKKPQFAAVLARDTAGRVGDFVHLKGADVDHLTILQTASPVTDLKLQVGQSAALRVVPSDATGETLAGAFTYTWSTQGSADVVDMAQETDIDGAPKSNAVVVTGTAAGTVDIVSQAQDKSTVVHVTVGG